MTTAVATLKVGSPKRTDAKLTPKKRKIVLESLSKSWNKTLAASKAGVSRASINQLIQRDQTFAAAYHEIEQSYLDVIEEVSITVASDPSREGYNDRRLQLESRRRESYGKSPETAIQINVDIGQSVSNLKNLIDKKEDSKPLTPVVTTHKSD